MPRWGGRRKDEMKLNGPFAPPFYKAARQPKSHWADFAIIAKLCQKLDLPAKQKIKIIKFDLGKLRTNNQK